MTDMQSLNDKNLKTLGLYWEARLYDFDLRNGGPLISADSLPYIGFEADSAQFTRTNKADNTMPAFTYQYFVAFYSPLNGDGERVHIMGIIRAQLMEWLGNWSKRDAQMRQCVVSVSQGKIANALTIDIYWPNLGGTPCLQALDDIDEEPITMALNGYNLHLKGIGPRPVGDTIAMDVMIDPRSNIAAFKEAFDRRLGPEGEIADIYKYDQFD